MSSIRTLAALFAAVAVGSVAAKAPVPAEARTYEFKARIVSNRGITPLKQDTVFTGRFTCDLRGEVVERKEGYARYKSKRNAITVECGELRFASIGGVEVTIRLTADAEEFVIAAGGFSVPKGWELDPTDRQPQLELRLSRDPSRDPSAKVFGGTAIPARLSLPDFDGAKTVALSFGKSVSFPGGKVDRKPGVLATLESLEEVRK
jgi:hypothetical protein